ncbi:hypothetical protein AB6A40_005925 [Gnathostoma spinigerum]|uniref:peptidylprolyl isomerase n=1 Tax=Gnathostoma spinigerum TaxID=75299 RepID=A0ABD6EIY0_9BILA
MGKPSVILVLLVVCSTVVCKKEEKEEKQILSWKDDDGLEVKIVRPIKPEKCKIKSQPGDVVDQYYKLTDKDGKEIGSNFGQKPYTFTLGNSEVIEGMDRAMTGMCIGEKRKVVIPPELGFGAAGRERDAIEGGQTLFYLVQLVDIFRAVPGPSWTDENGLQIEVTHKIDEDKCRRAEPGDTIHQHYVLHLADGTFVDSSYNRGTPFIFRLSHNEVIAGMDQAMMGMCEGERRKLVIPSNLAYGDAGRPPSIPPKATLYFDIHLLKLIKHDEL